MSPFGICDQFEQPRERVHCDSGTHLKNFVFLLEYFEGIMDFSYVLMDFKEFIRLAHLNKRQCLFVLTPYIFSFFQLFKKNFVFQKRAWTFEKKNIGKNLA
jgi:hypothetical protein